jgi:signal transduction histidine kinase
MHEQSTRGTRDAPSTPPTDRRRLGRLEELVSVVSHDLRTPLTTARSAAELAEETGHAEHFGALARAHERMDGLLDEVLALARADGRATTTEPVTLAAVARDAWETVAAQRATLTTDTDRVVAADPDRLQRLFENPANATTHAGPEVAVTVGSLGGDVSGFYVAADGPGIDPAHRETVFDPGVTTSADGTGFGLATVDRIADAHGWDVDVTESAGGGARFEFVGADPAVVDRSASPASSD